MRFKLSKYILPSVVSMVIFGTNTNIDGFFIGNIMGDEGLAAINIVWPIVAFIMSVGTGIGVGGSVIMNKLKGGGYTNEAKSEKKETIVILLAVGIAASAILSFIYKPVIALMGADGNVFKLASHYARVFCIGSAAQIAGSGLVVILRNDGKTYESMIYSVIGFIVHLLLDILLVKRYSMGGVAAASVISQTVVSALCFWNIGIDFKGIKLKNASGIFTCAAAPFGLNFVPSLVLMFTNFFALKAGSVPAVSAYAVMSYAVYTFDYIFQGVCDGVQPIISYLAGADDFEYEKKILRTEAAVLGICCIFFILSTPFLIMVMPKLFSVSGDAEKMMKTGFWIYAFSYIFKAAVKFVCSYYYAAGESRISNILVYIDPLCFTPLMLFICSGILGTVGVWSALPLAQLLTALVSAAALKKWGCKKSADRSAA